MIICFEKSGVDPWEMKGGKNECPLATAWIVFGSGEFVSNMYH